MSSFNKSSTDCKFGIKCWSKDCQYLHPQAVVTHHSHNSNPGVEAFAGLAKAFGATNGAKLTNMKVTKPQHGGRETVISAETVTREEKVQEKVTYRPHFDVVMVLDISGSMAGSPSQQMFEAVQEVFDVLDDKDGVSIILFNDTAATVLNLKNKENMDFPTSISAHLETYGRDRLPCFKCSKGTALWDAILGGLEALARRPRGPKHPSPTHPHLVVITDGADCSSQQESFESIKTKLHEPGTAAVDKFGRPDGSVFANFHATCITVGSGSDEHVRQLSSIAAGRSNVHHYNAKKAGDIKECFREVTTMIERVRVCYQRLHLSVESVTKYKDEITGGDAKAKVKAKSRSSSAGSFRPKPAAGGSATASVKEAQTPTATHVSTPRPLQSLSARTSSVAPDERPSRAAAAATAATAAGGHFRAHGSSAGEASRRGGGIVPGTHGGSYGSNGGGGGLGGGSGIVLGTHGGSYGSNGGGGGLGGGSGIVPGTHGGSYGSNGGDSGLFRGTKPTFSFSGTHGCSYEANGGVSRLGGGSGVVPGAHDGSNGAYGRSSRLSGGSGIVPGIDDGSYGSDRGVSRLGGGSGIIPCTHGGSYGSNGRSSGMCAGSDLFSGTQPTLFPSHAGADRSRRPASAGRFRQGAA